jgi:hypothetical protein
MGLPIGARDRWGIRLKGSIKFSPYSILQVIILATRYIDSTAARSCNCLDLAQYFPDG